MVLSWDRWVGKVAVVTGASSGIGASIAEYLVDKGLVVVGLARRSERVEEKAKQLCKKPGKLHALKADVSKEEDVVKAFKWIDQNVGQVNILINNAGISKENTLINGDASTWKDVFDINVLGLCVATREAVKRMTTNKTNGHIIHLNSVAGHKVVHLPNMNVYAASKYAVTALADTLRQDLKAINANNIRVTSISPGFVSSEMTNLNPGLTKERQELMTTTNFLKSEDIAEAIGYVLAVPHSVQINELTITSTGDVY